MTIKYTVRRTQRAALVIMVGHRSTLHSKVTAAVGYGGLPPCLDRFQAGRLGYMTKMSLTELRRVNPARLHIVSHEMSRGDGEKEARRNI